MRLLLFIACCISVAFAQSPPPATLIASGGLTHNLIRKLLPLPSQVSSGGNSVPFWFADLYFCGAQTVGTEAKVLGILYPGTAPQKVPAPLLVADDCKNGFSSLKNRVQSQPSTAPFIATTLTMAWASWNVSFRITQTEIIGSPSSAELAGLRTALASASTPIAKFNTTGLTINLGSGVTLPLDAALSFDRDSTLITLFLIHPTGGLPQPAPIAQLPPNINADVHLPYAFLNYVLKNDLADKHFVLSKNDAGTVELVNPIVSFTLDQFVTQGTLHHVESNQDFSVYVSWAKSDLTLSYIKLDTQPEQCSDTDVECKLRNNIRGSVAGKIQSRLQTLYQGAPLHPTNFSAPVPFTALGTPIQARIQTTQGSATNDGLQLNEIIVLEKR
jgi:hypothetical protein